MRHPIKRKRRFYCTIHKPSLPFFIHCKKKIPIRKYFGQIISQLLRESLRNRAPSLTNHASLIYIDCLNQQGFQTYLQKNIGGGQTLKSAKHIVRQVSVFLSWFTMNYPLPNKDKLLFHYYDVRVKLFLIFKQYPESIALFLSRLEDAKACKPMTCYNYLWSNVHALYWLLTDHYHKIRNKFSWAKQFNSEVFLALAKRIAKQYK